MLMEWGIPQTFSLNRYKLLYVSLENVYLIGQCWNRIRDSGNKGNTVGAKLEAKAVWLGKDGCWLLRHFVSIPWQISFPQRSLERSKQPQWCVWDVIILPGVPQAGLYHSCSEQVGRKLSLCFVLQWAESSWEVSRHQCQLSLTVTLPQINSLAGICGFTWVLND